jgi:hypothetical protein
VTLPFSLSDAQLGLVCEPLDPSKRAVLMERVAGQLRFIGLRRPTDADVERAIQVALTGLLQGSAT